MSSKLMENIDVCISPLVSDLKKRWFLIIGIFLFLIAFFCFGAVRLYHKFGLFEIGGANTMADKIWVIYSIVFLSIIITLCHYSTFLFGEKIVKRLFCLLSADLTYIKNFNILFGISAGDDLGWEGLGEKLGFIGSDEYSDSEDTIKYEKRGICCEATEIYVYNTVGSGKRSSQILLQHGLFFRCLFDKKITTQQDIHCLFNSGDYRAMKKAMRQKLGHMSGFPIFIISGIFFCVFFLVLFGIFGIYTLLMITILGIVLIILAYIYFNLLRNASLKKEFLEKYQSIVQSQNLPELYKDVVLKVFNNNALVFEDDRYTYFFYPLTRNFCSANFWDSTSTMIQKVREDLQLFFGVIEWMEKVK